ncbi:MAG TPA: 4-hydroxythreonine-4-phosphate dehydrogenase PdxA [Blastocatellia bacterium]|nr:4-hydroxythreonine-4-phosphate dehydrogenase PdxA [Blastocatellia bacterium]
MTLLSSHERPALRPRIGITIGDPAGIGPEVALRAVVTPDVLTVCYPILIGDADYLLAWAKTFGLGANFITVPWGEPFPLPTDVPLICHLKNLPTSLPLGQEQAIAGRAAGDYVKAAVQLCLAGQLDAMTTAPLNKKALHLGGYDFPGHTEMLAHLTGTQEYAMSFIAPNLRVALLTTHLSLAAVPEQVKKEPLERLIRLVQREMIRFGVSQPRIAVAALNPHAGEGGLFGTEEAAEMNPAIEACRAQGINVSGPHSGDTIFLRAARGEFDLVISCYHDQGLIPIKCFSFGEAVNVTLGLPFVRTSVDHGTGFDIAGQGKADPASMITAIKLAAQMALQPSPRSA